jgi:hypothetical protein
MKLIEYNYYNRFKNISLKDYIKIDIDLNKLYLYDFKVNYINL